MDSPDTAPGSQVAEIGHQLTPSASQTFAPDSQQDIIVAVASAMSREVVGLSGTGPTKPSGSQLLYPMGRDSSEDESFESASSDSESDDGKSATESECTDIESDISNSELADILPRMSRPVAPATKRSKKRPRSVRQSALTANEVLLPKKTAQKRKRKSGSKKTPSKRAKTAAKPLPASANCVSEPAMGAAVPSQAGLSSATASFTPVCNVTTEVQSGLASGEPTATAIEKKQRNLIYAFYEEVPHNAKGAAGAAGDKHYQCYHAGKDGGRKILTLTRKMKGSVTGLTGHLERHFPHMHRLYELMRCRKTPPSVLELQIARGEMTLPQDSEAYIKDLEDKAAKLMPSTGPWDQAVFTELLAEWIAACDQPFDAVEKPEFIKLLQFVHHRPTRLAVPSATTIKRRISEMSDDYVQELILLLKGLPGKVSLSLDAWSSSNGYAFLAIVMHYVTNDWQLGTQSTTLIPLQESESASEHAIGGENMADVVWRTMAMYGITDRVLAINCDNATSNDTLLAEIEHRCNEVGIPFSATNARMRCVPHTVHLSAIELLATLGIIKKSDANQAASSRSNYQDSVTAPTDREYDNLAGAQGESESDIAADAMSSDPHHNMLDALRKVIRAVRASPQRRQAWLAEVKRSLATSTTTPATSDHEAPLMLILDVPTRWSSTHQMLRRALDYRYQIDSFVATNRDLRSFEMASDDWEAIEIVTQWLRLYRDATTEMSTTKQATLSEVHTVFKGLQDHVRACLRDLPSGAAPALRTGLLAAHQKLSDYYFIYNGSPFYTWASILDPRINYSNLVADSSDDPEMYDQLADRLEELKVYFKTNYCQSTTSTIAGPSTSTRPTGTPMTYSLSAPPSTPRRHASWPALPKPSPKKANFTARYDSRSSEGDLPEEELTTYLALRPKSFKTCNPLQWWSSHAREFPNLSRLARDILTIPGCAVAVERVFSGGRDTISLRRASLQPDTIRKLMLVKHRLRQIRNTVRSIDVNE
ncbi:hypothetical protein NUW54_g4661 [Trametes sanguinea]|uniref:Uncharacterized protein n=1 Tax=Trametes sanguinea TaxID=158606 RepID=A0ACC1PZ50_9APHY|nr:hypothetical protein NUW54_g4661 [Trametes sanguinea]